MKNQRKNNRNFDKVFFGIMTLDILHRYGEDWQPTRRTTRHYCPMQWYLADLQVLCSMKYVSSLLKNSGVSMAVISFIICSLNNIMHCFSKFNQCWKFGWLYYQWCIV